MRVLASPNSAPRLASRCLAGLLSVLLVATPLAGQSSGDAPARSGSSRSAKAKAAKKPTTSGKTTAAAKDKPARKPATSTGHHRKPIGRAGRAARTARTARIKQAFVASTELRPMAQQLATLRTPAAFAGVTQYAHQHSGEAAAAAYLALGHAYLLDKRFGDAESSLREARQAGEVLADYADFLGAQSNHEAGNDATAEALLHGFAERYPDSIFNAQATELEANVLLAMNNPAGAQQVLAANPDSAARPGYQLAQGEVALKLNQNEDAKRIFKHLLLSRPLTSDAQIARAKLTSMGAESTLTTTELRSLGDAYYNANRFEEAAEQYRALLRNSALDANTRNGFAVAEAACQLKLKQLTTSEAEALADTPDENGARRLYLLLELARNRNDLDEQQRIVTQMESTFPHSPWLAEALFSSGNMYMLRHDYAAAVNYYSYLTAHFPDNSNAAAAHWRAAWFSYRQGLYPEAARLFDEQLKLYPNAIETASALYWRGRLYEMQDQKPALAAANYRTLIRVYQHFFYAQMARERLAALGDTQAAAQPVVQTQLDDFQAPPVPHLDETFPTDSPHLAKARLLANAGLNDYIAQEIAADPDSASWSALAEAQIYASYGETYRAMRALKKALPYAATASIKSIPLAYWRILFPEAWWDIIKAESAKNNLDPYMVASLIRQESEFNPSVVSYANAYGLMQLLPSVGRQIAREEGISHFETYQLLDPATNIRLGTRYLRQMLDKFGGIQEYALAAYNAGDSRVADWEAAGPYHGMDEFVESIPFTQTREYVEAILRNEETYRAIDDYAGSHAKAPLGASR
jgi:soluble lytic murein transglycosylase